MANAAYQAMIKQAASLRQNHERFNKKLNEVKEALDEKNDHLNKLEAPLYGMQQLPTRKHYQHMLEKELEQIKKTLP